MYTCNVPFVVCVEAHPRTNTGYPNAPLTPSTMTTPVCDMTYACLHASSRWVSLRGFSCVCCCRSLLGFESSVSIAFVFVAPTANPLQQQQSYWFLFGFQICKDLYVWMQPNVLNSSTAVLFFVYYSPNKSIKTTRNCRLFGPWAVRAVVCGDV